MIIDDQTFTELTLHLRRASDGLLGAARKLSSACDPDQPVDTDRADVAAALDSLLTMNHEFSALEDLLRVVWEANRSQPQHLAS